MIHLRTQPEANIGYITTQPYCEPSVHILIPYPHTQ